MKHFIVSLIIFGCVDISFSFNASQNLGVTGRYCYRGGEASEDNYKYDTNQWCGAHPFKYPGCVYIISSDNYITMGCGNDGGDIPACYDEDVGCSMQGGDYVCCCTSDNCNNCPDHLQDCRYPVAAKTTTASLPINPGTTHKPSTGVSPGIQCFGLILSAIFIVALPMFV